jgi:hypothetical protein
MHGSRTLESFSIVAIVAATLSLTGCMSLLPFDVSKSELVGTWESKEYDAELVLHDDLTFELTNTPIGYVDISTIDLHDPNTPNQERITLTGSWKLEFQDVPLGGDGERGDILGLFPIEIADDYVEVWLSASFWGKFERIYLIQGDPDSRDFLWFSKRETDGD